MSFSKGSVRTNWASLPNGGGIWQKTAGKARGIFQKFRLKPSVFRLRTFRIPNQDRPVSSDADTCAPPHAFIASITGRIERPLPVSA